MLRVIDNDLLGTQVKWYILISVQKIASINFAIGFALVFLHHFVTFKGRCRLFYCFVLPPYDCTAGQ